MQSNVLTLDAGRDAMTALKKKCSVGVGGLH